MKAKTDRPKTKPTEDNKRPVHADGIFFVKPGEDPNVAERRAWMTGAEFRAWSAEKDRMARAKIEAAAWSIRLAEREAAATARKARMQAEVTRANTEARERAQRERQAQDDLRTLAEAARAKMPTKRKPGPGRKRHYTPETIKTVESAIKAQGGSIKAAAEVLKMPCLKVRAIHDAARKRRGRKT